MAKSFTELVRSRREKGEGFTGSISYGIKERLKEKFDPRRMINQKGLLTALFPSLKAYQAGGSKTGQQLNSPNMVSASLVSLEPILESVDVNTKLSAKNSMVLPMMHRDINVIRQNMVKLVSLKGGTPATKADMFFMKARDRQAAYDVQSKSEKTIKATPKDEDSDTTFLGLLLKGLIEGLKAIGKTITEGLANLAKTLPSLLLRSALTGLNLLNMLFGLLPFWVKGFLLATGAMAALLYLMGAGNERNIQQKKEFTNNNPVGGALMGGDEAVFAQVAGTSTEDREAYAAQQKKQQDVLEKENAPFMVKVYKVGVPEFLSGIKNEDGKRKYSDEDIADITGWPIKSVKKSVAKKLDGERRKLENTVGKKATMGRLKDPEGAKKYDDIVAQLNGYGPEMLKSDRQEKIESEIKQTSDEKKGTKLENVTSGKELVPVPKESGKVIDGGSKLVKSTMKTPNENTSEVNVNNNNNTVNKKNQIQVIPSAYDPTITTKFRGIPVVVPIR